MKQTVLNLMQATGAFAPFRQAHRRQALVLTYHRFSEREDGARISARAFAEQLDYLTAHYTVVPLSHLAEQVASGQPLPPGLAAVTIDDGYWDSYEIAFPLLRQRGIPATVFAVTEFVDRQTWLWTDQARYLADSVSPKKLAAAHYATKMCLERTDGSRLAVSVEQINATLKTLPEEMRIEALKRLARALDVEMPKLPPREFESITWQQAIEMDRAGVEIGSHTMTHPILPQVGDEQLRRELQQSRERLEEKLGRTVDTFCYPNGDNDARVLCEVERAGYQCAVTCEIGLNQLGGNPLALRRIHGEHDLAHFIQSTSGFEQVKNRCWAVLSNLKDKRAQQGAGQEATA